MTLWRFATKVVTYGSCLYCFAEYGVEAIMCDGPSMQPTVEHNDVLLAEHVSVMLGNVGRNDVVVCINPVQPSKLICKRITAVEGDTVDRNKIIPRGHVWLAGDNTKNSLDSTSFGPVPYALIRSRVVLKVWPLSKSGWLSTHWFYEQSL